MASTFPPQHSMATASTQTAEDLDASLPDHRPGNWWDSKRARLVLIAIILFILAIDIKYLYGSPNDFGSRILNPLADAALVICATVVLTEFGPLRSHVEELILQLKGRIDGDVLDRLSDPKYLRDNFCYARRERLRMAATRSSLPTNACPGFLEEMEKFVIPLAGKTVWREDYQLELTHECNKNADPTRLKLRVVSSWLLRNIGGEVENVDVKIRRRYARLEGVPDDQLCWEGWYALDDRPTKHPLDFRRTVLPDSDDLLFEAEFKVRVGAQPVRVRTHYRAIEGPLEAHRLELTVPTHGVTVTYVHPDYVSPKLYFFAVGGESRPKRESETMHVWEHTGHFLPSHGVVLTRSLIRRKSDTAA